MYLKPWGIKNASIIWTHPWLCFKTKHLLCVFRTFLIKLKNQSSVKCKCLQTGSAQCVRVCECVFSAVYTQTKLVYRERESEEILSLNSAVWRSDLHICWYDSRRENCVVCEMLQTKCIHMIMDACVMRSPGWIML